MSNITNSNENNENASLDLWYHERHGLESAFGLHVKNVLFSKQSKYQRVDVFESTGFGRVLTLDGLMMCTERDEFVYHEMIAHVPMLAHNNPERVLIIGGGDGGTMREVLKHPCLDEVVLCEIDEAVIEAGKQFFPCFAPAFSHPKARVLVKDGVQFVKDSPGKTYDVVIIDSADPIGPGVGLFSESFYSEVKRILRPGGIVVAQCESPWEEKLDLEKVYGNLKSSFKHVHSMVGTIPSYPFGYWSWGFASDTAHPFETIDYNRAKEIVKTTRYYNTDVHKGAFMIPNFLREKIKNVVD